MSPSVVRDQFEPAAPQAGEGLLVRPGPAAARVVSEQLLDLDALADLIHEGIEQSQRERGVVAQTSWWDAVAAAELLLFHVTSLTEATGDAQAATATS